MTLKELKHLFLNSLNSIYPINEINELFYISVYNRMNIKKIDVLLDINKEVDATELIIDLDRLKLSEPFQYIYQHATFFNLDFKVTPDVLIPRQETEELVQMIINSNANSDHRKILDMGTGSGVIAISLAKNMLNAQVFGTDFSENAIQIALENASKNGVKVAFIKQDILLDDISILPHDIDIIVSNPPYIPFSVSNELHRNVVQFEPHSALFVPDHDPILFYKKIAEIAYKILKNGGQLYFETFESFHKDISQYLENIGFSNIRSMKDFNGKNRFISAEKIVYLR